MKVISADPGNKGAFVYWEGMTPKEVFDNQLRVAGSKKITDYLYVGQLFLRIKPDLVIVEQVGASPRMGTGSSFNFGASFGIILGAAAATGAQVATITPQKWKAAQGLLGKPKDAARGCAIEKYPQCVDWFKRKKDVDRADALLLGDSYLMFNGDYK